jgi:hypothetical protein
LEGEELVRRRQGGPVIQRLREERFLDRTMEDGEVEAV